MSSAREIIAFDMDGVLVDSKISIIKSLNIALLEFGFRPVKNSRHDLIGMTISEMLLHATNHQMKADQLAAAIIRYRAANDRLGLLHTRPYKDIKEVLQKLSEHFDLIVVTSKLQRSANELLRGLKLDHYFVGIFGPEVDGISETKDLTILRATAKLKKESGHKPKIRALVGDRNTDITAAIEFGIQSVSALWGYGAASELKDSDIRVNEPNQLISVFLSPLDENPSCSATTKLGRPFTSS